MTLSSMDNHPLTTPEAPRMTEIDLTSPSLYINRELSLLEF